MDDTEIPNLPQEEQVVISQEEAQELLESGLSEEQDLATEEA